MNVEKKMIRSDIPGHSAMLTGTMPYNTAAPAASVEERRLMVGRGIVLNGQITDCQHLAIEGTVTAETLLTQRLDILESGSFTGTANVQDAVIAGRFDGKLVATGRLTVKSTAHITGDIEYGALEIESGSRIEARIAVRPAPTAPAVEKTAAVTAKPTTVAEAGEKIFDASNDEAEKAAATEERPGTFRRAVGY
jgi:cytoskeletal protein CcmA (bactofilin family)